METQFCGHGKWRIGPRVRWAFFKRTLDTAGSVRFERKINHPIWECFKANHIIYALHCNTSAFFRLHIQGFITAFRHKHKPLIMSSLAGFADVSQAAVSNAAGHVQTRDVHQRAASGSTGGAEDDPLKKKKTTKRRKVNHACLYCRRSHMTCDEGRPCQRWSVSLTQQVLAMLLTIPILCFFFSESPPYPTPCGRN